MMYCPRCGRELPENGVCDCTAQNNPVQSAPDVDPAYTYPPDVSAGGYAPPGTGGYIPSQPLNLTDPPAVAALRNLGRSPLMLALCILFTTYFLSSFPAMLLQPDTAPSYYYTITGVNQQAMVNFPLSVTSLTTVIGLWLLYAACLKAQGPISTAGITVLKVFYLIGAIASLLFLSLLCVGLLLFPTMMTALPDIMPGGLHISPETLTVMIVIIGVVGLFMLGWVILGMIFTLKTLNGLRDVARSGMPNHKTSMVLIAVLFVQAFFMAISAPTSGAAFFSPLLGAAATVVMALVLLRHRKNMQFVTMQSTMGGYIPPMPPQNF